MFFTPVKSNTVKFKFIFLNFLQIITFSFSSCPTISCLQHNLFYSSLCKSFFSFRVHLVVQVWTYFTQLFRKLQNRKIQIKFLLEISVSSLNFGYCKYGSRCRKIHNETKCENKECDIRQWDLRHP